MANAMKKPAKTQTSSAKNAKPASAKSVLSRKTVKPAVKGAAAKSNGKSRVAPSAGTGKSPAKALTKTISKEGHKAAAKAAQRATSKAAARPTEKSLSKTAERPVSEQLKARVTNKKPESKAVG